MVRITTWNVNGIRNPFGYQPWRENRTFAAMFDILETDIVVMQELKIQRKDLTDDMVLVPGWDCYFSLPKHKKGYSGVAVYTRQSVCAPIRAEEGILGVLCPPASSTPYRELPEDAGIGGYPTPAQVSDLGVDPAALDAEGRCLVVEFPAFVLFGVYSPANSNGLRDDFRYGFLTALDTRIRNLTRMGKNVILTGDLNVSRDLIDTAKAEDNMHAAGMTHEDYLLSPNRRLFNQLLLNGKIPGKRDEGREEPVLYDLCREFHPDREGMFTHWEQKINARPGNFGSRIDFVLCSIAIKDWFKEANVQEGLMGSDHCPVYAVTKDKVPAKCDPTTDKVDVEEETHVLDQMNPPGMFKDGVRQREYNATTDILPLSGKLLPEFNKRRNIRDMFFKKAVASSPASTSSTAVSMKSEVEEKQFGDLLKATSGGDKDSATSTPASSAGHTSSLHSPEKRPASTFASPDKSAKRSKKPAPTAPTSKGQQSLKGFFQSQSQPHPKPASPSKTPTPTPTPAPSLSNTTTLSFPATPEDYDPDPLASQEASKEGWTKLFSKKPPPRCDGHAEPCISHTTKKPGANCGRMFWVCGRPIGPSGHKETGTQWRCGTFVWASDWK
ncbi:DNase I-like protein [Dothidotthia symphoricarpi CBS 119687]|uniref:DNA-(apurinic or apyrimidinic site) endonuclease 2 n=1 Tax=Dothidotthia symphoricarpi CBS 119687 TaxID=1392245 RepID=A0A6A6AM71_9PLEO|nr:DNase I-like protein [Dothidotthia symphoricarpi CBS 119687]KAF2132263.1 DNase I-like protein [Dothidotthia symphoricarpi CBS 119687]